MKIRRVISIVIVMTLAYVLLWFTSAESGETQRPNVRKQFSKEKEAKIQALKSLTAKEVFNELQGPEFMSNRDASYKAIHEAYSNRKTEALSLAQRHLMLPLIEVADGQRITRGREFNIANKIFRVFPDEATPILVTLYNKSDDEITRGNIILATGGVAGGEPIDELLVTALDDKFFGEEVTPEMLGEPLRVCDLAYNQIVLRHGVRNVLRTISSSHNIETRDYHINMLKSIISERDGLLN